ncbi:hypothetical protein EMCRGX_G017272 [Ephydatia muelleri]
MLSENVWLCVSIQIALFATLQATQAPGDGSSECQNPPFTKTAFPSNMVSLMDSYDYLFLTVALGGPWSTLDVDGDARTWAPAGDTSCRQVTYSCSYNLATQNNWLITQHINTTVNGKALSQVVVRVNFTLNGCPTGGSCQQSFLLQMYQTRNIDPSGSINLSNYAPFSGSRVTVGSNPSGTVVDAQDVTVQLGASGGLYLAAQDTGYYRPAGSGAGSGCIVARPPSAPQNLTMGAISATAVVLSWSPPQDSGGVDTVFYTVYYQALIIQDDCGGPEWIAWGRGKQKHLNNFDNSTFILKSPFSPTKSNPIVGVVVAVVVMVGALLFVLILVGMLKHTSKSAMLQGTAVTLSIIDQPPQPVQPTYSAASGQETATMKSAQPVQSMQHTPNAYQPLSKEFTSSPS